VLGGRQVGRIWAAEASAGCGRLAWYRSCVPGLRLLDLTPAIVVESTRLPQPFHKDPADQIIVATARIHDCPLATADDKILNYGHVRTVTIG
jgi:PIN domain nuclease of toxin-antitoxin system